MLKIRHLVLVEQTVIGLQFIGIMLALIIALSMQFFFKQLPCPLCTLQRLGFFIMSAGFLLNIRFGLRPSHYAITLLGALLAGAIALRHIYLHLNPNVPSYGSLIFGLGLYHWVFILVCLVSLTTIIQLSFDRQYDKTEVISYCPGFTKAAFIIYTLVILITISSNLSLCNFFLNPQPKCDRIIGFLGM